MPELSGGVLTALIVPCDEAGKVDTGSLAELIEFQATTGVAGLFVLGTAGQGPMFTADQRRHLLEVIVETANARLAVVAHIGAMPTQTAMDLAIHAMSAGVDAISSVPPVYYQPGKSETSDYYRQLRAAAASLPLLAYNNPGATGYDLRPDQAALLRAEGTIAGVKQASASIPDLHALLAADVPVWMANAACNTAALSMGAVGSVSTITNVAPEKFVALFDAVASSDVKAARGIQHDIDYIALRLRSPIIGALHAGVSARGLPGGRPRPPLRMPTDEEMIEIREAVTRSMT